MTKPAEPKEPKAPAEPKEPKEPKAQKSKDVLMTVPSTGEKVVYSEKVHGKDYREIAQNTANKFGGVITEIE